ncbi:unnamed protein product [Albugo candida]|uniref:Uncharacterized protein n=1 Tax=Albugo candida TaxID=65357 RepID=A0A024G9V5_9STRA|nr:unnamed protein product [Albugo candida]|eukprot:CCI43320.1 unnamed protein product [Albugo candida]
MGKQMEKTLFPSSNVDDTVVSYEIYVKNAIHCSDRNSAFKCLNAINDEIAKELRAITGDFFWHREKLSLRIKSAENGGIYYLQGQSSVGDAIQDEWVIAYTLVQYSRQNNDVVLHISDNDGEFFLIECAYHLPLWVKPEIMKFRMFIKNGKLHLIEPSQDERSITLAQALESMFHNDSRKYLASSSCQEALETRLNQVPKLIQENKHCIRCILPLKAAYLLWKCPEAICGVAQAFYYREPEEAARLCHTMENFRSPNLVQSMVTFTRCTYAQMKQQESYPHNPLISILEPYMSKPESSDAIAAEMGMKVTCGLELLSASQLPMADGEKLWAEHIHSILSKLDVDDYKPGPLTVDDDDSWMHMKPETLEEKLANMESEANIGKVEVAASLTSLAHKFKDFIDKPSDLEGVENSKPVRLDADALLKLLDRNNDDEDLYFDREDYDFSDEDHDSDQDAAELEEMMEKMDTEIANSTVRTTSLRDGDRMEGSMSSDFDVISNLLQSIAAQEGQPGPAATILHHLD